MKKAKTTKLLALFLVMAMIFTSFTAVMMVSAADEEEAEEETSSDEIDGSAQYGYSRTMDEVLNLIDAKSYTDYSEKYKDIPKGTKTYEIMCATDYVPDQTTAEVEVLKNFEGAASALRMGNEGQTTFSVNIKEEGRYAISLVYYPVTGSNTTMERMLFIDGHIPFSEARYFYLPRVWSYVLDEEGGFDIDINGNNIRPVREEKPAWQNYYLRDWLGYTIDPFEFYFSAGEHTLTFEAAREPMVIEKIIIYPYIEEAPYEEVLAQWKAQGLKEVTGVEPIKVQAEKPDTISIQNMFPSNDRTSCLTEPQDPTCIRYNIMDYGTCGQWIRYKVDVPEEGLYSIVVRFRQNSLIGMFTSRRIRINGEIQFREASYCRFKYDTGFQSKPLNNGETDFLFHLNKGENEIEFEVVIGELTSYVYEIEEMIEDLREAYNQILMITGPSPDAYRDYGFTRIVPEAVQTLARSAKRLFEIANEINEICGEKGDQTAALETYAKLFKLMAEDEYEIAGNFTNFKNYTVNLSNWLYSALAQPLKMDFFVIQPADEKLPQAVANFFQASWFELKAFVGSFFMDYTTIGFRVSDDVVYDDNITMWASSDRETMLISRRIIDSYFTPEYNIGLTIKVISAGLTEAIIAGIGPDIAGMGSTDCITWGLRTAVEPLNDFEGFDEVMTYFTDAATVPLTLYGTTYGLPESMSFNMVFYRLDVLAELGLEIPKTWQDLYDMLPVIQNKHLEIGLPIGLAGTNVFLYQQGIELYKDDGMRVNLDSNEALSAFESFTDFFTKYSCKASWDMTRFRSGDIPIMIGDAVGTYNLLMGYSELRGLWEMAPLLGTINEEGVINNTSVTAVSAIIIPRGANNPESSWKYLKWNATADTKQRYVNETIAVSAPTTKVATPNLEVFLNQPWTTAEYSAISTQLNALRAVPEYPGGYIVTQYVSNAFYDVYNNNTEPSNAMLDRIYDMNKEISRKRNEFKMQSYEDWAAEQAGTQE